MFFNFGRNSQHKRERDGFIPAATGSNARHVDPTTITPAPTANPLSDLLVDSPNPSASTDAQRVQGTPEAHETNSQGVVASPTLFSCQSHEAMTPRELHTNSNNHKKESSKSNIVHASFHAALQSSPVHPRPHHSLPSTIDVDAESDAEEEEEEEEESTYKAGPTVVPMAALHNHMTAEEVEDDEDEQQEGKGGNGVRARAHNALLIASNTESVLSDQDDEGAIISDAHTHSTTTTTTSSSSKSSSASSHSSMSDIEDGMHGHDDSVEDREKRYPRFTSHYASHFRHEMVPFLQVCQVDRTFTPGNKQPRWQQTPHVLTEDEPEKPTELLLYGSYLYRRTLGKGTYSKVVLAEKVGAGAGGCGGGVPQVALKIFRDKDAYREACWDEVAVLQALCTPPSSNTNTVITTRTANGARVTCTSGSITSQTTSTGGICCCPSVLGVATAGGRPSAAMMNYCSQEGHFMSLLEYIPHPVHPAIVFPVLGPSLLHVVRLVKHASRIEVRYNRPTQQQDIPKSNVNDVNEESEEGGQNEERGVSSQPQATRSYSHEGTSHHLWRRGLPLVLLKSVLYQLLLFLRYIHSRGVVHTDLKPENVLFESQAMLPNVVPIYRKTRQTILTMNNERNMATGGGLQDYNGDSNSNLGSLSGLVMHSVHTASPNVHQIKEYHNQMKMNSAIALTHWQSGKAEVKSPHGAAETQPRKSTSVPQRSTSHTSSTGVPPPQQQQLRQLAETQHSETASSSATWQHDHDVTVSLPLLNSVRVIDVGTAQFVANFTHRSHIDGIMPVSYDPIQTSHYRSPEVLMGVGWGKSADLFSLGCMIPELVTGECVFMPKDTLEHLALMQHIIGPFRPSEATSDTQRTSNSSNTTKRLTKRDVLSEVFACNGTTYTHYFTVDEGKLRWPVTANGLRQWERDKAAMKANDANNGQNHHNDDDEDDDEDDELEPLTITTAKDIKFVTEKPKLDELLGFDADLLDLTRRMLCYDPIERISAEEALQHQYFHTMQ